MSRGTDHSECRIHVGISVTRHRFPAKTIRAGTSLTIHSVIREARDAGGEVHDRMPAFLTLDAMDAWLEPVKLDRSGGENMLALLDGSSTAVASTIEQYVVDRKVNNSRTVNHDDSTLIVAVS